MFIEGFIFKDEYLSMTINPKSLISKDLLKKIEDNIQGEEKITVRNILSNTNFEIYERYEILNNIKSFYDDFNDVILLEDLINKYIIKKIEELCLSCNIECIEQWAKKYLDSINTSEKIKPITVLYDLRKLVRSETYIKDSLTDKFFFICLTYQTNQTKNNGFDIWVMGRLFKDYHDKYSNLLDQMHNNIVAKFNMIYS